MSKMSQLHTELTEQASELGFESIEDAENNGYEVVCDGKGFGRLVKSEDELDQYHRAWLKKRDEVISSLNNAIWHDYKLSGDRKTYIQVVMQRAIDFIQKECHD